jgi:hypothetical protein
MTVQCHISSLAAFPRRIEEVQYSAYRQDVVSDRFGLVTSAAISCVQLSLGQ